MEILTSLLEATGRRDYPRARRRMIRALARRGIEPRVLAAMARLPRHAFVPRRFCPLAYEDRVLRTGRTHVTNPSCVARMTAALSLEGSEKVLEIGTGSGYQTAVLALLSAHVYSLDCVPSLVEESGRALAALGLENVSLRAGDGGAGWPEAAPFDAILVTAAAPEVPDALLAQLHPGHGRLVMPLGPRHGAQRLCLLERKAGALTRSDLGSTCFVPLAGASRIIGGTAPPGAAVRRAARRARRCKT